MPLLLTREPSQLYVGILDRLQHSEKANNKSKHEGEEEAVFYE